MDKVIIPGKALETRLIEARLRELKEGEIVTWAELETLTSRPHARLAGLTNTARKTLRKESIHIASVHGEGLQRLTMSEVVQQTLPNKRDRVRNGARELVRVSEHVNLSEVSQSEASTALAYQTMGKLVLASSEKKQIKALAAEIEKQKVLAPLNPKDAYLRMIGG